MTGPVVILVGAPGAGKTTVGKAVAKRLKVTFRDTDSDIEATAGKAISDIFVDDGEPAFRQMEREAVATALAEHDGVLSLGGGAVLDPVTREALQGRAVVWLEVGIADATRRVGMNTARPLLVGNVRGRLIALLAERAPFYAEVAFITVPTDGMRTNEIADVIVAALQGESND